jgi:hypothetical protein
VTANIDRDGSSFVRKVAAGERFQADGIAHGSGACCCWSIVDPRLHPLHVWRKSGSRWDAYGRSATELGASVFTNGPMMGKRLGRRKLTRHRAAWELAKWSAAGAGTGFLAGSSSRSRPRYGMAFAGAAVASSAAWWRVFTGWIPCADVLGRQAAIADRRDFELEGAGHSWFGRFSIGFDSYAVGSGQPPEGVLEGLGGLISLVRGFRAPSKTPGSGSYDADFAALSTKKGVAAWGLVPLDTAVAPNLAGVVIVLASREFDAEAAAALLGSIGARDAVAMDQGGSVMLGAGHQFAVGPPPFHRQAMQTYGLCCRPGGLGGATDRR